MAQDTAAPPPRFVVGIDLGTTNSAVARVDTEQRPWRIETFAVPQLVAPSTVERRETLPSFHYQPTAGEAEGGALALPWKTPQKSLHVVGVKARERGAEVPGRLTTSAKSWLSHSGIDRTAAILPWHGSPEVRKLSPMVVSARYLEHVRRAWDHEHDSHPLKDQDVVLTVPASFDEIARELTVAAARQAGLPRVYLIEEPQSAFYAWIDRPAEQEAALEHGQSVLVVDVGGGTTDLTLIRVEERAEGESGFRRVAVGEHLILGGDNLDLALAHHLEARLGGELSTRQWSVLIHRARQAKEALLGADPPEGLTLTLPGSGSRLLGGGLRVEVSRDEARELLIEGFLPAVALGDRPAMRASGFRELGLPYAPDSAITRYLAHFLSSHSLSTHGSRFRGSEGPGVHLPEAVLLNGGFFAGEALRERLLEVLASWYGAEARHPRLLRNERLDLAVAHGAAYFGMVRRGEGERIRGGLAHAYYVGAERAESAWAPCPTALCLAPAGLEEGHDVTLQEPELELLIREPVEFPIFTSSTRSGDRPGDLVEVTPEHLSALPPIRTVLRSGKKQAAEKVKVRLHARLTEIGTLAVWCSEAAGSRSWRLEFDVRSAVATDVEAHEGRGEAAGIVEQEVADACGELVAESFGPARLQKPKVGYSRPERLMKRLEEATGQRRWDWPPSLLRTLWQALVDHEPGRSLSIAHEARWLNLVGFALRPGFGVAVDDWRVACTWQLFHRGPAHARNEMCRGEWWVLWRRISGGLTAGQQRALAQPVLAQLKGPAGDKLKRRPHELAEIRRLLASLEWLEPTVKEKLGEESLAEIERDGVKALSGAHLWALARLGSRVPAYGSPNGTVGVETVERWLARAQAIADDRRDLVFAVLQMARRTADRYRDVSKLARERALTWLADAGAPGHYLELVREVGELETGEERLVFGESLPKGLTIR